MLTPYRSFSWLPYTLRESRDSVAKLWDLSLALSLTTGVTLGKLFNYSVAVSSVKLG